MTARHVWTDKEDELIVADAAAGRTRTATAETLDLPVKSVFSRIRFLRNQGVTIADSVMYRQRPKSGDGRSGERRCMCCTNIFHSAGPHNRLCIRCRGQRLTPFDAPVTLAR